MLIRIYIVSLILALCTFIMLGCTNATRYKGSTQYSEKTKEMLSNAQRLYADGVIFNMRGQWAEARDAFDAALHIVAQIDLEENESITEQVDALLREIAYDYRFTLSQSETLTVESAPVVLSLALSEKPFSDLTEKRLKQLMQELPEQSQGAFDFPIVFNDAVKEKIVFFQTEAKNPLTRWLGKSYAYLPMIRKIFKEEGIPLDLAYLPLIESGFNNNAYSWAHAVGMWQFIKSTAQLYGLQVGWWLDERRDPEKSTRAAAKYLKNLYSMFGDWHLALAAYNCGEGRVGRAISSQKTNDYWKLKLPTQTENYVPLFIAALIIAKNPQKYGFTDVVPESPLDYDIVWVDEVVDLKLASRCCGTDYDLLRTLNPELVRGCTPPKVEKYPLKLEKGKGMTFVENYRKIPESEKVAWHRHEVKKGESLWTIARRYGTSVQALIDANNLKKSSTLQPGSMLLIPLDKNTADRIAKSSQTGEQTKSKTSTYTVKKGDTISEIAQKHGSTISSIASANGLTPNSIIKPGQKLTIPGSMSTESSKENATSKSSQKYHQVKNGESLWTIARKYGLTVSEIKKMNSLTSDRVTVGQVLSVGTDANKKTQNTSVQEKKEKILHTVKDGESLWAIAKKYGVAVREIENWNQLSNNSVLQVGQKLSIFGTASNDNPTQKKTIVHTISHGETLWHIAKKYGTTVSEIMKMNGIASPAKLKPGDKLTIVINN